MHNDGGSPAGADLSPLPRESSGLLNPGPSSLPDQIDLREPSMAASSSQATHDLEDGSSDVGHLDTDEQGMNDGFRTPTKKKSVLKVSIFILNSHTYSIFHMVNYNHYVYFSGRNDI